MNIRPLMRSPGHVPRPLPAPRLGEPELRRDRFSYPFNRGAYFLAEQTVFREPEDPAQGLALFFRYGVASGDVNTLDYSYSIGLRYKGLLPGRDEDEFGIGLTRGHAGAKLRQAAAAPAASNETALEITYRAKFARWLAIQPTVQRIANPGLDPTLRDAWIAGARFEISF